MGPLTGLRVVELASVGPGPFTAMVLADLGADVLRVEGRPDPVGIDIDRRYQTCLRGRPAIELDLKDPAGVAAALELVDNADVVVEGWRPGVAERLGVGPDTCLARNPRLVYGRITGWGQDGPLAGTVGHDIDYIALSGVLHMCGRAGGPPTPPLNLAGDYGGGGMLLVVGILAAVWEAAASGRGQVVDAAMVDGSALLSTTFHGLRAAGLWSDERGTNLADSGSPWYDTYETSDGRFVAVGAVEEKFRAALLRALGIDELTDARGQLAAAFRTRTRDEWAALLDGTDTCVAPVLGPGEAPLHPHNQARATFVDIDGIVQPAPAPRFSRTPTSTPTGPTLLANASNVLDRWHATSRTPTHQ